VQLRVVHRYEDCAPLRDAWNDIVFRQSADILQLDVTSTFEWAMVLWRKHLNQSEQNIVLLEEQGKVLGIFPLYRASKTVHAVGCASVAPFTEIFSGRGGFLLDAPSPNHLRILLDYLYKDLPDWDVFVFTLVDGSPSSSLFFELQKSQRFPIEQIGYITTPYIMLEGTWPDYFASLPKKFRWNLRNAEKKMKAQGDVRYREFGPGSDLDYFAQAMLGIEKESWKESTGTSLTASHLQESFHTDLLEVVAGNGWFWGHLLELNGEPVAYVNGLKFNNVFCDLKESYKSKYKELSPGHVLKTFVMERMYASKVNFYDYMGLCEDYKMRWTDKTYSQSTYILYNKTLRATAARMAAPLAKLVERSGEFHGSR